MSTPWARSKSKNTGKKRRPASSSFRAESPGPAFSSAMVRGAEAVIAEMVPAGMQGGKKDQDERLQSVIGRLAQLGDKDHRNAVRYAYCLHVLRGSDVEFLRNAGVDVEKKDRVRAILERVLRFGDVGAKQTRDAQKLYSRDTRAIRNLETWGVHPNEVLQLAAMRGEGLVNWANGISQRNPAAKTARLKAPREAKVTGLASVSVSIGGKPRTFKIRLREANALAAYLAELESSIKRPTDATA